MADALDLGSSVNDVGVQVPYSAPFKLLIKAIMIIMHDCNKYHAGVTQW